MRIRSVLAMVAGCLLIAGSPVVNASAQPAAAGEIGAIQCVPPSSAVTTFTPPISNAPGKFVRTTDWSYGPCVSTVPGISSGTLHDSSPSDRSCLDLLDAGSLTMTITWNTGARSTIKANRVTNVAGPLFEIVFTGTVTKGLFAGKRVVQTLTAPSTDLALCHLGAGSVPALYSALTLSIT